MIAIGADHGGFELKEGIKKHLDSQNIKYIDYGTFTGEAVDYPDIAVTVCDNVVNKNCDKALLFCGTGVGISISANKVNGIRACCCTDEFSAEYCRLHNDANALCLGGRVLTLEKAIKLVDLYLNAEFEGDRHARRVGKIMAIEQR